MCPCGESPEAATASPDPSVARAVRPKPMKRGWAGSQGLQSAVLCLAGVASLVWFLVRVIPKPSRAAYPCQRAAFPVASGFVLWLAAVAGSMWSWRRSREGAVPGWKAFIWGLAAVAGLTAVVVELPAPRATAGPATAHPPLGEGQGIFPGRVVWVHAPEATSWAGYSSTAHWWEPGRTDLAVVEEMMTRGLQSLTGASSDPGAW